LDPKLKVAFDFDLFLRFFKRYPRQIGMVRRVQAYSRLHATCMTKRLRREVALEGMYVISKELGVVPDHWFWTHVDEICESYPFGSDTLPLKAQVESFLKDSQSFFHQDILHGLVSSLKSDWRLRLSTSSIYANIQPDGWVSKRLLVKYRWSTKPANAILINCRANWPVSSKLRLKVLLSSGEIQLHEINIPDDFTLRLEVPKTSQHGSMIWVIETAQTFIPSKHDKKSNDSRRLSFQVLGLKAED
jgi:hypothetical protein